MRQEMRDGDEERLNIFDDRNIHSNMTILWHKSADGNVDCGCTDHNTCWNARMSHIHSLRNHHRRHCRSHAANKGRTNRETSMGSCRRIHTHHLHRAEEGDHRNESERAERGRDDVTWNDGDFADNQQPSDLVLDRCCK